MGNSFPTPAINTLQVQDPEASIAVQATSGNAHGFEARSNTSSCSIDGEIPDRSETSKVMALKGLPENERIVTENNTLDALYTSKSYLGEGGFGVVIKGQHYLDQSWYAIKLIGFDQIELKAVVREVMSLASLSTHNNIVSYKGCWIEKTDMIRNETLQSKLKSCRKTRPAYILCVRMECCQGSLKEYLRVRDEKFFQTPASTDLERELRDGRAFSESKHRTHKAIFVDILKGLSFLHERDLIHRDLKPGNILFDSQTMDFKITDFGLARQFESNKDYLTNCGTLIYAAPEQTSSRHYDKRVDIHPLGIILFELMYPMVRDLPESDPPAGEADSEYFCLLKDLRYRKKLPDGLTKMHPRISNHILHMISENPDERPSLKITLQESDLHSGVPLLDLDWLNLN